VTGKAARFPPQSLSQQPDRARPAGNDATLATIGKRHGKTAAQVSLRFLVQEGAIVIPRTERRERLEESMGIFDFQFAPEEMADIRELGGQGARVVDCSGAPEWD
jgi:2,5-diketo-D-gluconate reductase B